MSNGQRAAVLLVAIVALVAGFFALRPGGDDESTTADTTPATTPLPPPSTTGGTPPTTTAPTTTTAPRPSTPITVLRVRGGQPVGGVKAIRATKGNRVRFEVRSPDTADEVHVHGYDIRKDLEAGGRVRFSFDANAEGIFEVELEGSHTQIAKLEVRPG